MLECVVSLVRIHIPQIEQSVESYTATIILQLNVTSWNWYLDSSLYKAWSPQVRANESSLYKAWSPQVRANESRLYFLSVHELVWFLFCSLSTGFKSLGAGCWQLPLPCASIPLARNQNLMYSLYASNPSTRVSDNCCRGIGRIVILLLLWVKFQPASPQIETRYEISLCFRYTDSTILLLAKSEISSL